VLEPGGRAEPGRAGAGWAWAGLALLGVVYSVLVLATYLDYGITTDEPLHREWGQTLADYFLSWGRWRGAAENPLDVFPFIGMSVYGTVFDLPMGLWSRLLELDLAGFYRWAHLFSPLWGLLALGSTAALAWRLGGPEAGCWASWLLFLCPRFYGHSFNNIKDVPLTATMTLAVLAIVAALDRLDRDGRLPWLGLGLAMGLCVLTRLNGLAVVAIALGGLGLMLLGWGINRRLGPAVRAPLEEIVFRALLSLVAAFLVNLALWPFLQQHPLEAPAILQFIVSQRRPPIPSLFLGRIIGASALPWYYLPAWLAIGLPPVLLLGAGAGLLLLLGCLGRGLVAWLRIQLRRGGRDEADRLVLDLARWAVVLVWVAGLAGYLMLNSGQLYDGMRLFLFLLPGLACLAGLAFSRLLALAARRRSWAAWALAGLLLAGLIEPAAAMIRLHPYQVVYFSSLAGGLPGAEGRFDLDYWAGSTGQAARWLTGYTRGLKGPLLVKVTDPFEGIALSLGPNLKPLPNYRVKDQPADFFLTVRRWDMADFYPQAPVIHRVERQGVCLAVVKQLRPVAGLPWPPGEGR